MIVPERDEVVAVDALLVDVQEEPDSSDLETIEILEHEVEEPRPQLRVAPDGYRRRRRVRIAAAAAAVSISVTLFAVVGFNVVLAQHQIELQSLQKQLQIEESRYYDLRNEVAQASSPPRIVSRAAELGLVEAPMTYVPAAIKPPAVGPTDTAKTLRETSKATGGSLDHPVP